MKKRPQMPNSKVGKESKVNPIDLFKGKIESHETISQTFSKPMNLKTPSGERTIVLEPGKYDFLRINSPNPLLTLEERKRCPFLALKSEIVERQLIFGKLESTFISYTLPQWSAG